jgi:hypothetical protein
VGSVPVGTSPLMLDDLDIPYGSVAGYDHGTYEYMPKN